MSDNAKVIGDWQDKVRQTFGDESKLYEYLFETLENFFYRYLETTENKGLKVSALAEKTFGAMSFESNMVDALKLKNPMAKPGIMELAKTIPKAQKPLIQYGLQVKVEELVAERGHLVIISSINWDFPQFLNQEKITSKKVDFKWQELAQFRKELALKLEEACELFN